MSGPTLADANMRVPPTPDGGVGGRLRMRICAYAPMRDGEWGDSRVIRCRARDKGASKRATRQCEYEANMRVH